MPIKGYIEQVSNRQVRGWAYRPDRPDEHLRIEIACNTKIIATAQANLFRDDLKQANVGSGDHAFVANFPEILDDRMVADIVVSAVPPDLDKVTLGFVKKPDPGTIPAEARSTSPVFPTKVLAQHKPVFVLGAARSGTSAMAQSLMKTGYYEGYEEGHIFDLAARLIGAVKDHYEANGEERLRNTLIAEIPIRFLNEGIKDQFRAIARFCFRGEHWLDKTPRPEMIQCAPLLLEIWPHAKFVFMKRRAIENISSRLRKFPQVPFRNHCLEWTRAMSAWRSVRHGLGSTAIEIEQLDMATDPVGVVRRLERFLEFPATVAGLLEGLLAAEQPERTADRFGGVLDLDELDWPIEFKAEFGQICMSEMEAFGYGTGKRYHVH